MQEALQIDSTRTDILTAYASYLARFPERVAEAQEVCVSFAYVVIPII